MPLLPDPIAFQLPTYYDALDGVPVVQDIWDTGGASYDLHCKLKALTVTAGAIVRMVPHQDDLRAEVQGAVIPAKFDLPAELRALLSCQGDAAAPLRAAMPWKQVLKMLLFLLQQLI